MKVLLLCKVIITSLHYFKIALLSQESLGSKYGLLYLSQGVGALLAAIYSSLIPFWTPIVLTVVVTSVISACLALILKSKEEVFKRDVGFTTLLDNSLVRTRRDKRGFYEELELEELHSSTNSVNTNT